jgi:hypothetical protein
VRIQDDDLWTELWDVIAICRDQYPRDHLDAPTDEIVDQVMQVLARRGLTERPPRD